MPVLSTKSKTMFKNFYHFFLFSLLYPQRNTSTIKAPAIKPTKPQIKIQIKSIILLFIFSSEVMQYNEYCKPVGKNQR